MSKKFYSYTELNNDMKILAEKVRPYEFEMIIPITRGGLVPAGHLGYLLNIKNFGALCLNSYHGEQQQEMDIINIPNIPESISRDKILVVDSMVDKGTTLEKVRELLGDVRFLTIHLKPHSKMKPDFYLHMTDEWIVYPWEYEE